MIKNITQNDVIRIHMLAARTIKQPEKYNPVCEKICEMMDDANDRTKELQTYVEEMI